MKKVLLGFLAIAITLASCKDYDDEFDALNATIADLQTQVAGFSTLQTSLTDLETLVGSLNTAVALIPTNNDVDLTGLTDALAEANAAIVLLQEELADITADYASTGDIEATEAAIAALLDALYDAENDIAELLAANNVYDDNLTIASAADLAFAIGLGDKVGIINGNVTISYDDAGVDAVTVKILNITGFLKVSTKNDWTALVAVGDQLEVNHAGDIDEFTALASVGDDGTNSLMLGTINVGTTPTKNISFPALTTITGGINTGATANTITSAKLETFSFPVLTKVPALTITGALLTSFDFAAATETLGIVTITDANNPLLATIDFGAVTKIGGVVSIEGNKLTTVDFGALAGMLFNVTIDGDLITSIDLSSLASVGKDVASGDDDLVVNSNKLLTLDLSALAKVYGSVSVGNSGTTYPTAQDISVDLTALTMTDDLTITSAKTVALPALVTVGGGVGSLVFARATSLSAPLAKVTLTTADSEVTAAAVKTLVIGTDVFVVSADLNTEFPALENLTLNGTHATATAVTILNSTTSNEVLKTITLGGNLAAVALTGTGAITTTSITTSGSLTSLSVTDFTKLTTLALGHAHNSAAAGGHNLSIIDNVLLTTFATSALDYVTDITITGNVKLADFDLSSVKTLMLTAVQYQFAITGNHTGTATYSTGTGMKGSYTAPAIATGSVARVAAGLTQASLATLKPMMLTIANGALATPTATALTSSTFVLDYIYLPSGTAGVVASWASTSTVGAETNIIDAADIADLSSL